MQQLFWLRFLSRKKSFIPLWTPLIWGSSYVPLDPDKRLYKQTFGNEKRHWKSDQQSWQHIRGYRELAKITGPADLEGHWCPSPLHTHIFADTEKKNRSSERQSIDILPLQIFGSSTDPECLEKRTETVLEIITLCSFKVLGLPPSLDKHYINVVVVAVSTFVKLLN